MTQNKRETSNEDRRRIIQAYLNNEDMNSIGRVLNININTIKGIIRLYEKNGRVDKMLRGGPRNRNLSLLQKDVIKNWVEEDCSITLKALKEKCFTEFGVRVSQTTINRMLSDFNFTLKRVSLIPERRNSEDVIELRASYAIELLNILSIINEKFLFFVDESGFKVLMRARRGRSLRGSRAVQFVPNLRTRNISLCCTMNKEGIYLYETSTRPYNSDKFCEFIIRLVEKINNDGIQKAVIIMDNVPFHKVQSVKEIIQTHGHSLLFLPPYSPFLNPIENLFSKWKQTVSTRRPSNEEELLSIIDDAANFISESDCEGFYRNMLGFISRCILKETIIEE